MPVGGSPPGSTANDFAELKGNGTGLVAFDRKSGREVWRCSDELASYASPRLVNLPDGKRGGFWLARGGLVGFDPALGKQTFHFPWRARSLESVNASTAVVQGDEIFITGKETAIYFPREEHSLVRYDGKDKHFAVAIPAGEARYVMNRKTGEIRGLYEEWDNQPSGAVFTPDGTGGSYGG